MKLATTTCDYSQYTSSQAEAITWIREAGFHYVDYNFGMDFRNGTGVYTNGWKEYLTGIQELAKKLEVQFVQAHAPMGTPIARNEEGARLMEATKRCIEACGILGIPNVVVHSGYEKGLSKAETFARNREFYMELVPVAEENGVHVLAENFNHMGSEIYWMDNAPDLREFIDYINHPMIQVCWDTGHGNEQPLPQHEALKCLGAHVYALHVQDNVGRGDYHQAPFCGTMNMDSLISGLLDIGYKGYFTFEACNFFMPESYKKPFPGGKLNRVPLELKNKAERMLYELGEYALRAYDCFEE